jgi:proteasome lid subunit RPN8/RPN11
VSTVTEQTAEVELLDAVETHAFSDVTREVGGVLVGEFIDDRASVEVALPALKAVGAQTNVTFTHEVWQEVLDTVERRHVGKKIVGWYHTHPGFGLFLSDYGKFIHRNFFTDPRMVALVVDPLAGELGWFRWQGDDVVLTDQQPTMRPAVQRPQPDGSTSSSSPSGVSGK